MWLSTKPGITTLPLRSMSPTSRTTGSSGDRWANPAIVPLPGSTSIETFLIKAFFFGSKTTDVWIVNVVRAILKVTTFFCGRWESLPAPALTSGRMEEGQLVVSGRDVGCVQHGVAGVGLNWTMAMRHNHKPKKKYRGTYLRYIGYFVSNVSVDSPVVKLIVAAFSK